MTEAIETQAPKVEKVLLDSRFGLAETKRNQWFATVPETVTPEDLLEPSYWAHVARTLRPLDEIIVTIDSCSWRVVLLVEDAWHNGARVIELSRNALAATTDAENDQGLRVQWRGPHSKFCVVRKDGVTIKEKLPSREVAISHLTGILNSKVA